MDLVNTGTNSLRIAAEPSQDGSARVRAVLLWAWSYGLFDRSDQASHHLVLHGGRLLDVLEPELSAEGRLVVLKLVTWLAVAEQSDAWAQLSSHLFGDRNGARRIEHAIAELRPQIRALGFDLALLQRALEDYEPKTEPCASGDRAYHWISLVLRSLGICQSLPDAHSVHFALPHTWATEVNPRAFEVADAVEDWLRTLNLLQDERIESKFHDFAVAEYGGWPCPTVEHEKLFVLTGIFSLWLLHDDLLEGSGLRSDTILANAVSGRLEAGGAMFSDRHIQGWVDLSGYLSDSMSAEWLARLHDAFLEWTHAVAEEAELMRTFRNEGTLPSAEDYLPVRSSTIGMAPTICLAEYILDAELPREILDSPHAKNIIRMAGDLVAYPNEMMGFSKDTRNRMINMITCLMDRGLDGLEAFRRVASWHDETIPRYVAEEAGLLESIQACNKPLAAKWLTVIRHMIYGFGRWHSIAIRYSDVHALDDGSILRVCLREDYAF